MTSTVVQTNGIVAELNVPGADSGPLQGTRFVAKDLFDIEGQVTGAGNPHWQQSHSAASTTSKVVSTLLAAGAKLVGKACTDEFAYSIDGINIHYGAPVNPQFPGRVAGGSSSGSASAVAAQLVDFALGTDTGGSIRIPASYCGIYGFRPTHGRISMHGVLPLAPTLDTVGWLARDPQMLKLCGSVLLNETTSSTNTGKLLLAQDAFDFVDKSLTPALESAVQSFKSQFEVVDSTNLAMLGWHEYNEHYRILQGWQAWRCYGEWITSVNPVMDQAIKDRFEFAKNVTQEQYEASSVFREKVIAAFATLLGSGAMLCMPTAWSLPPAVSATSAELINNRTNSMKLTCVAPLACLPQVTIPVKLTDSTKIGLSFLASKGSDMSLLNLCQELLQL